MTVRISVFFRDAFPHAVSLLDDAVVAVAGLDEPENFVRAHALAERRRMGIGAGHHVDTREHDIFDSDDCSSTTAG